MAVALGNALFEAGINVLPVVHPAVPERAARLRFFLTARHEAAVLSEVAAKVADAVEAPNQSAPAMMERVGKLAARFGA
ncbi:hypothetical protein KHP62_04555 [Rhodobacteraceae bacterium NNCM2]|nr:hypothetical protein [Coraliihabitans acroporae]